MNSYDVKKFRVGKGCSFQDNEVEEAYIAREYKSSIKMSRYLLLVAGILFFSFIFFDYSMVLTQQALAGSLVVRVTVLALFVGLFFATRRINDCGKVMSIISIAELIFFFAYMAVLYFQRPGNIMESALAVMLIILVIYLVPGKWIYSLLNSIVVMVGYMVIAPLISTALGQVELTRAYIYIVLCLVFSATFMYSRNVSRRRHYANEVMLEHMSRTDPLTGAYNRAAFEEVLCQEMNMAQESGRELAFMMMDLDHFKKVNDVYGHTVGDDVLREFVQVVRKNIREDDIFARWGGEEFVLLCKNTPGERGAELAERLRKAVDTHYFPVAAHVTMSCGVTRHMEGDTMTKLVMRADELMYAAKKAGRNDVVYGGQDMAQYTGKEEGNRLHVAV